MTLYDRIHSSEYFVCADCNDRSIPRSEFRHHQDHHNGNCRCNMAEHRMIPMWLRNSNNNGKVLA
jgi:hypothetical protein